MSEWLTTFHAFLRLFRRGPALPMGLVFMPVVVAAVWPLAIVASGDDRAAFMLTFVIAMALRFALGADRIIRKLSQYVLPRTAAILVLMTGPGIMALLIWSGEPVWCQRFLSLYFGAMTLGYMADVLSGEPGVLNLTFARNWTKAPATLLARMMVIYHLAMLLLNETLIATAGLGAWLVFFALLPQISQRMALALVRTAHPMAAV
jgi:hypothetical protein